MLPCKNAESMPARPYPLCPATVYGTNKRFASTDNLCCRKSPPSCNDSHQRLDNCSARSQDQYHVGRIVNRPAPWTYAGGTADPAAVLSKMPCMGLYIRQHIAPAHEVDNLLGQQHQIGIQIQIDISRRGVFQLPADWFFL